MGRIPAQTPEGRNPRPGDPGRTLIDLFAWMGDKLLYRVNLLPERQRLMFLKLLDMPLRPATPATGQGRTKSTDPTWRSPRRPPGPQTADDKYHGGTDLRQRGAADR